jgi:hypothetical protein
MTVSQDFEKEVGRIETDLLKKARDGFNSADHWLNPSPTLDKSVREQVNHDLDRAIEKGRL